jgi:RNA polymerase sigma-70 factor, ECF subfamily
VSPEGPVEIFQAHRATLLGVAYRVLGRWTDAEDVVQEAWLRWSRVDPGEVLAPRAYLIRVAGRLALDRLRHEAARRESYVGAWLPEPVSGDLLSDIEAQVEVSDTISIALLTVLETLSPAERAVFVLHEAFGIPFAEIAEILDRAEPAVRQLGHRARTHVRERRPRYPTDRAAHAELTRRFLDACRAGDLDGLLSMLAPDVEFVGDGGGIGPAPIRAVRGAAQVAQVLLGIAAGAGREVFARIVSVNAGPAIVASTPDGVIGVVVLDVIDGLIRAVHAVSNPEKLSHVGGSAGPW